MTAFVDTSAFYALLDRDDDHHAAAHDWARAARGSSEELVTHNYVVVETAAVAHRRLGAPAVRAFREGLLRVVSVGYVDERLDGRAWTAYLASLRRGESLVDRVSFEYMRDRDIERAFAFDADFSDEGFETVP
ncbi:MAG: type II toxin-antitoxin system VapC family toxin [Actinomycetota bacterium]